MPGKSENRFSDKDMRQRMSLERIRFHRNGMRSGAVDLTFAKDPAAREYEFP